MKGIFYITALLCTMAGTAQTFEWLKTPDINLGLNPDLVGYATACDASGNIYMTGFKENAFAYSDILGSIFFNKYASSGELLFSKTITGKAASYALAADSQGNVVMALGYYESITIGELTLEDSAVGMEYLIVKLDSEGNLLWHHDINVDSEFTWTSESRAIAFDNADNIYIGYDDYGNSFITKYTPDGDELLTIEQMNVNRVTSVSVDNAGNIYAAGSCANSSSSYAGVLMPAEFSYNTYVVKYSPTGEFQWLKYVDDITCPEPHVVARTPNEVYFSSYLFGSMQFGDIVAEGPQQFFEDFFIAKLNSAGNYQWVREVPGSGTAAQGYRNYLSLDHHGNIYFAGRTGGTVNWGNGMQTTAAAMGQDCLVLKYSPEGEILMAATATGDGYDRADGVTVNHNGDIFLSGMASGNCTFGDIAHEADNFEYYPFLAKMSEGTMGNPNPLETAKVTLYPNPSSDIIYLSGVEEGTPVLIINALGQTVKHAQARNNTAIDVTGLAKGAYFVKPEGYNAIRFIRN